MHLRLDGATGIGVWWRDQADHHVRPETGFLQGLLVGSVHAGQ